MGKFKNTLARAAREELEKEQEQKRLREKHHVEDEQVLVVETSNMGKFLIRTMGRLLHFLAAILLLGLAAMGALAVLYPNVRLELWEVLLQIWREITAMFG